MTMLIEYETREEEEEEEEEKENNGNKPSEDGDYTKPAIDNERWLRNLLRLS